jgi:hypothetical protein
MEVEFKVGQNKVISDLPLVMKAAQHVRVKMCEQDIDFDEMKKKKRAEKESRKIQKS